MDEMNQRFRNTYGCCLAVLVVCFCWLKPCPTHAGPLRINLSNGTAVEVPYYWEEKGEIKFEMPGGVAGIPKSYVTSVQEIVTMREFDPEVLVESKKLNTSNPREQMLVELVEQQRPPTAFEKLSPEESLGLIDKLGSKDSVPSGERIFGPKLAKHGDFAELVRMQGNEVMLVMQNIVTSRDELKNTRFSLILYDYEGNVLQTQPCELYEVDVDNRTKKNLGIQGHLFTVIASIKPDSRISRYEISVLR
jgi:hypothetical protein